ncbi:hypothetical protein Nepgr_019751 [Nepenthes gracilis]|uniref:Pentatricopeptide repeat-containing protein n=1 Tax=Nepenthes gracilis TaxID=150966 RepID=A0AAD3XVI7_NEPGR|nr:hypothetical protein Nepgr_019751 [Nepenthes gracilis]
MMGEIEDLVCLIDQKGLSSDSYTFTAFAGGILKRRKLASASKLLLHVVSRGYNVDVAVYNVYIHSLCLQSNSRKALSLIENYDRGFIPDIISYNTILSGFCMESNIDIALKLLDKVDWPADGPDIVSFNTLLSVACKQGNSLMVQQVLDRMEYEGVKPNVASLTCLIQYFGTVGQISVCFWLLKSMILGGPASSIFTFNVLIGKLCKNWLLGVAYQILKDLRNTKLFPNTSSYNILTHAALRADNNLPVEELLMDMYCRGLKSDAVTCRSLINGLCKVGKVSAALELHDQMLEDGIMPCVTT